MIHNQLLMFSIYIITGLLLSFVFDFFIILRKCIKTSNLATYIEDIFFWIIIYKYKRRNILRRVGDAGLRTLFRHRKEVGV